MGVAIFTCDGCGKQEPGDFNEEKNAWEKPRLWYVRTADEPKDEDGFDQGSVQLFACGKACIEAINTARNERPWMIPGSVLGIY